MRFHEINESINDKGIFKAVFLAGLPGAGKSTVTQKVTDGAVNPRIVNTDRSYEFLLKKHGKEANREAWKLLGKTSEILNKSMLENYLNGMLPMFIDGTSSNPSSAMRRAGIVESLGYDIAMVWVNITLDTALKRIAGRERKVNTEFVKSIYETIEDNKGLYKSRFGANFIEVNNNNDNFSAMEGQVYNTVTKFFSSPVINPIGKRIIDKGEKYLIPNVYDSEYINKIVNVWYNK